MGDIKKGGGSIASSGDESEAYAVVGLTSAPTSDSPGPTLSPCWRFEQASSSSLSSPASSLSTAEDTDSDNADYSTIEYSSVA